MAYRTTSWKNTDIGKIPSDWGLKKLSDIFTLSAGGDVDKNAFSSNKDSKHPYPIYANALVDFGIYGYSSSYRIESEAITITGRGGVGHVFYRAGKFTPIVRLLVGIAKKSYDTKFLSYAVQKINFYVESTGVSQLTVPQVGMYMLSYPKNLIEQQKIAEVLTDIDDLIAGMERVRDKKIAIKTGAMQELLRPKECWISKKLDKVCDNIFAGGTPSTANEEFWKNGDIIWLPSGMVQDAVIERRNAKDRITAKGLANSSAKLIKAGTTILAMTGATCGKVAYLPFEAAANQSVMAFETTKISSKFLFYLLLNNKDYVLQFQAGGAQAGINKTSCKNFEFSFPSTKLEQEKIAQILSDMDDEISAISNKINKYKQIKSGVAGELLSGRIRLIKPQE